MKLDILEKQRVTRRSRAPHLDKGSGSPKHGFYSLVRQIRQKPVHLHSGHKIKAVIAERLAKNAAKNRVEHREEVSVRSEAPASVGRSKSAGFSFPLPSLMTSLIIAGIIVVAVMVLKWPDIELSSVLPIDTQSDPLMERNLASYAGITSPETPVASDDIPLNLIETFDWTTYKVQKGDTISGIAAQFGISMSSIVSFNGIDNARRLREGASLKIPNMEGLPYTIKKGDTLEKIAKSLEVPLEVILDVNDIRSDVIVEGTSLFIPGAKMAPEALKLALGEKLFLFPVKGRISDNYGWRIHPIDNVRHFHAALDVAAHTGERVNASRDGIVSAAGTNAAFGKFIIINHAGGYQSLYAHLSAMSVQKGDKVSQGMKIGEVGSTGRSTGPHLHFAIYKNERPVNPLDLL